MMEKPEGGLFPEMNRKGLIITRRKKQIEQHLFGVKETPHEV